MTDPGRNTDSKKNPARKVISFLGCLVVAAGILMILPQLALQPTRRPARLLSYFERHSEAELLLDDRFPLRDTAGALALYLNGQLDTPQIMLVKGGETQAAFSDRELAHLQDVRSLYDLAYSVFLAGLGFLLLAILLSFIAGEGKLKAAAFLFLEWLPRGALISLAVLLLLSVYVMLDFNGAFTMMHLSLFTNDLWLLDPAKDLLLKLMPEGFFIVLARNALFKAAALLLALIVLPLLTAGALKRKHRKE